MLTLVIILGLLWFFGLLGGVGGGLIHLLLAVAVIVFLIDLISGRRQAV